MDILIELTDAQAAAIVMIGIDKPEVLASNAVSSAIKGKLNYYINGTTVKTAAESTHSVVKHSASGVSKTVFYNGGLRGSAGQAYEMAKAFLPKEVTKEKFITSAIAEANLVLSQLTAKDSSGKAEDEGEE